MEPVNPKLDALGSPIYAPEVEKGSETSSMCDSCFKPGACCKGFVLTDLPPISGASIRAAKRFMRRRGLPFDPIGRRDRGDEKKARVWACRNILPNGRCGDYENRPQLCRDFKAGSDGLCFHFTPQEAFGG